MGSRKVSLTMVFEGITKQISTKEGLSWVNLCELLQRDDTFPGMGQVAHLVLLDPDGDEYSAPLKTEKAFWKIAGTYAKSPGFSFMIVADSKAGKTIPTVSAEAIPTISASTNAHQNFDVEFNSARGTVSVAEDATWDDLVAQMSEAVSLAGQMRVTHIRFVDEDDDVLSSNIDTIVRFWKFVKKIRTSFSIKVFAEADASAPARPIFALLPPSDASVDTPADTQVDEKSFEASLDPEESQGCIPVVEPVVENVVADDRSVEPGSVNSGSVVPEDEIEDIEDIEDIEEVEEVEESHLRSFVVVFDDARGVVSTAEGMLWEDFLSEISLALAAVGSIHVHHLQFVDADGDSLSSMIDSMNIFWKFVKKLDTSCQICVHGNLSFNTKRPVDVLTTSRQARANLCGEEIELLNSEFWDLCKQKGSVRKIGDVLQRGADLFSKNSNGSEAIHFAAIAGDTETLTFLVSLGCGVCAVNAKGFTPLHIAVNSGAAEAVKYLLSAGADIYKETSDGYSALAYILGRGVRGTLSDVYETHSFDLDHMNSKGSTLLQMCCSDINMNPALAEELLELGADIEFADSQNRSPLYLACMLDNTEVAQILLRNGANPNIIDSSRVCTPLYIACGNDNVGLVIGLSENGANQHFVDPSGNTALHIAASIGNTEVITYLLEYGASTYALNRKGLIPLDVAISYAHLDAATVFRNFTNPLSRTVMFLKACAEGNITFITHYIACGSDPISPRSENGSTGMHYACAAGAMSVAQALAAGGVGLNDRNSEGLTPFLLCCDVGQTVGMQWLHSKGVNIRQTMPSTGNTGLHLAALKARNGAVNWLLQHHVDTAAVNVDGITAQVLASSVGNTEISKVLSLECNRILDDIVYSIPGMRSTDRSRKVLAPVASALNRAGEHPVMSSIFDDFMLSFSCLSDSSQAPAEPVSFCEVEDCDKST
jgi:ankyrin repeat protein